MPQLAAWVRDDAKTSSLFCCAGSFRHFLADSATARGDVSAAQFLQHRHHQQHLQPT